MPRHSSLATLAGRAAAGGFRQDVRFAGAAAIPARAPEPDNPLAAAFAEGYAQGADHARAEAAAALAGEVEARAALDLSFTRLDAEIAETLRQRLAETVTALCEAALAPHALDHAALVTRIERAVAMLARADDERVIRLHPEDLKLVAPRLPDDWKLIEDPALPRGGLRVETANGGVEDGPAQWRRAITEALAQC